MASYLDAGALTGVATALVLYATELGLSKSDIGVMSGLLTGLFALGALVGGSLGDRYGRRTIFRLSLVTFIVGCTLLGAASNHAMLYAGIALTGLAIGADLPVSLTLAAEAAPAHLRGRMVSIANLLWILGIVSTGVISALFAKLGAPGGRIIFVHLVVVGAVVLIWRSGIPESKVWLRARDEAQGPTATDEEAVHWHVVRELFRPPMLASMAALTLFVTFWNLPANTFGQFGPLIWKQVMGLPVEAHARLNLMAVPLGLLFFAIFMKIVDGPNRQRWAQAGALSSIVGFGIPVFLGLSYETFVAMVVFFVFGAMFAGEGLFKVMAQEVMPTMVRSTSQGIAISVCRFGAAGFAFLTPALIGDDARPLFIAMFAFSIVAALVLCLWIPRLPRMGLAHGTNSTSPHGSGMQVQS